MLEYINYAKIYDTKIATYYIQFNCRSHILWHCVSRIIHTITKLRLPMDLNRNRPFLKIYVKSIYDSGDIALFSHNAVAVSIQVKIQVLRSVCASIAIYTISILV